MARNPAWSRDELILALELYFRIGIGHDRHPDVIELSRLLNRMTPDSEKPDAERFRNPNGVAMKLGNFARLDPNYQGTGLDAGGRGDIDVWNEFADDRQRLANEAARIRTRVVAGLGSRGDVSYWAFGANPRTYRIMDAMTNLERDWWRVRRGEPVPGDKVVVWKFAGGDGKRGVVGLGEVIAGPVEMSAEADPYWIHDADRQAVEMRVLVERERAPNLPLWIDDYPDLLEPLAIARATGGSIFHLTADQWDAIVEAAGGLPQQTPEVEEALQAVERIARSTGRGQGFRVDPETRMAIKQHAMKLAKETLEHRGWTVEDVSAIASFDLLCRMDDFDDLHVEVKGTTQNGSQILLTPNEVQHAKARYPNVALFVVSDIRLERGEDEKVVPSLGDVREFKPWAIDDACLIPLGFQYNLDS